MSRLLRLIWCWIFPVGKKKAIKIAMKSRVPDVTQFHAFESPPKNMNLYHAPQEPCWYVIAPWGVGFDGALRSSRIIIVSKKTGRVLYDGSANDEG